MERLGCCGPTRADRQDALRYVRYLDDFPAFPLNNVWDDTVTRAFGDDKVYVVQTNTKVIERCMLMSTDPGDLVLDPDVRVGHDGVRRRAVGAAVDHDRHVAVALALARQRLMGARFPYYLLADSAEGRAKEASR